MKVKTSELQGAALDWMVAKCEGEVGRIELEQVNGVWAVAVPELGCYYEPSTDWGQGGPIIERERIGVAYARGCWLAHPDRAGYPDCNTPYFFGETPLIAAMRCYVASRLGDEVEIPDELV